MTPDNDYPDHLVQAGTGGSSRRALLHRAVTRPAGLVLITGLAAGGGFAAVTGISSASNSAASTSTSTTTTAASTAAPTTTPSAPAGPGGRGGFGRHGGFGGPGGFGGFGGFGRGGGGQGTVTAISGSTLTLRTENGTETVKTTSATKYAKERQSITFAQIKVGDVVRIAAPRPTTATAVPGTGTVTAIGVDVVLPTLGGRVTAVAAGKYTVVGRSGALLTINVSSSTKYYDGTTKSTAAAVKVGSRIVAEGAQDTLTHLKADTVTVLPKLVAGAGKHGPGGWGPWGPGMPSATR